MSVCIKYLPNYLNLDTIRYLNMEIKMSIDKISYEIKSFFRVCSKEKYVKYKNTNLLFAQEEQPNVLHATLYNPLICLIIQGSKEIILEDVTIRIQQGEYLIVSHDLPVVSQIVEASYESPYQALILPIDFSILRILNAEMDKIPIKGTPNVVTVTTASIELVDALYKYLSVQNNSIEAKILGPMLLKEIHFRLLMASNGEMLRNLLHRDSHASMIARSIEIIREQFTKPLHMPNIAVEIGMSTSGFYKHFKNITSKSPLQYQKDLRLLEAQRLLSTQKYSVGEAAFEIGYESTTQFSREFSRKFGVSPKQYQLTQCSGERL